MTTKTKYGSLTLRLRFLGAALWQVRRTALEVVTVVTLIIGGSIVTGLGWAQDHPRLAVELAVLLLFILLLEGGYRLLGERTDELAERTGELEAISALRIGIRVKFEYVDPIFRIWITNNGPTLDTARFNLLVPQLPGLMIVPLDSGGNPLAADVDRDDQHHLIPGVPSIRLKARNMLVDGAQTTNAWPVRIGSVGGNLPIRFGLCFDELGEWRWFETTIVPTPASLDPAA